MKKQLSLFLFVALMVGSMFILPSCTLPFNNTNTKKTYFNDFANCEFTYDSSNSSYEFSIDVMENSYSKTEIVVKGVKSPEATTVTSISGERIIFGQTMGINSLLEDTNEDFTNVFIKALLDSIVIEGELAWLPYAFDFELISLCLKTDDFKESANTELLSIKGVERLNNNNYDVSIAVNSTQDELIDATNYFMFYSNGEMRAEGSYFQHYDYRTSIVMIEGVDYTKVGNYNATYKFIGGGEINLVVNVSEVADDNTEVLNCYLPNYIDKGTTLADYLIEHAPTVAIGNSSDSVPITEDMITGFNTDSVGIITVTVTYQEVSKEFELIIYDSENLTAIEGLNDTIYSALKGTAKADLDIELNYELSDGSYESVNINDETVTLTNYEKDTEGLQLVTVEYKGYSFKAMFYVHETGDNPVVDINFYDTVLYDTIGHTLMVEVNSEGIYDLSDYQYKITKMDGTETTESFSTADIEGFDAENLKLFKHADWAWFNYGNDVYTDEFMYTIEKSFTVGDYSYTANFYVIFIEVLY
ncbi:MAG: hypothetical protein PHX09_03340 [Clostridia bacterium]|nr:hypothetical protein [Clostridia bacterium]